MRLPMLLFMLLAMVASAGRAQTPVTVGEFTFQVPPGWRATAPTSAMRKAELAIADPSGGPEGQCSFFHFGAGQGGTAAANIERWYGQFQEPRERLGARVSVEEVGGTRLHLFRASGTFLSGMPGGPQSPLPGHTLLGAVLESPGGHVFVRCVATDKLAQACEPAFVAMVKRPLAR
ncbi:MAG: hypothetical protein EXQ87_03660 [Alphaproteobacteria bacterium]|nr:hypothetical protein [Alphaproteobacteria bacterium]